ncbi:uncharacterized protein M6B38_371585 [Iris pallida]|uniref:UBA domain-containing protein n=1 Tax=Iris pallida TaxID=29817 RepID=A0AAX6GCZ7_IRIPA|nr:uncharacterized protein M6B38_371585 [Iris pallida]
MSPASKSKSVAKQQAAKAIKEQPQISLKPSHVLSEGGDGAPASGIIPVADVLNTLDLSPSAPLKMQESNGQTRTIDDTEDPSLSPTSTRNEYDSASNNGSCSGESEDQKEKMPPSTVSCSGSAPVPCLDAEKREKVRLKNEKKHQRQRENRAKELHIRCTGYLKSRKREALAQQLVAMGFPSERTTMALILNNGYLEESVAWLLQQGEDNNKQQVVANIEDGGANFKVDISDELARIADMEIKFSCSKQEVERAVVCCQGDLDKAEDSMKARKQQSVAAAAHPKMEESGPSTSTSKQEVSSGVPMARSQVNGVASHHREVHERNLNCTESMVAEDVLQEATNRKLQSSSRRMHLQQDWENTQIAAAEKRWLNASPSPGFPVQVAEPLVTSKSQNAILGSEVEAKFEEALREPVKVMQRPQSIIDANQSFQSTSTSFGASPPTRTRQYPNRIYSMETMPMNGGLGHNLSSMDLNGVYSMNTMAMNWGPGHNTSSIGLNGIYNTEMLAINGGVEHDLTSWNLNGSRSLHLYSQSHPQPFASSAVESSTVRRTGPGSFRNPVRSSSSLLLAAPSSLGLFSGLGSLASSGKSCTVDWTTGASMPQCDYASVDWSPDLKSLRALTKADPRSLDAMSMGRKAAARPDISGGIYFAAGSQDTGGLVDS